MGVGWDRDRCRGATRPEVASEWVTQGFIPGLARHPLYFIGSSLWLEGGCQHVPYTDAKCLMQGVFDARCLMQGVFDAEVP